MPILTELIEKLQILTKYKGAPFADFLLNAEPLTVEEGPVHGAFVRHIVCACTKADCSMPLTD